MEFLKTTEYVQLTLRMLRRANYVPTLFPTEVYVLTAFRCCEHVSLWGACALSYSLHSLAFATRWNQKHPSYISIWLFLKFHVAVLLQRADYMRCLKLLTSCLNVLIVELDFRLSIWLFLKLYIRYFSWNCALKSALFPHANTQSPDETECNWSLR